MRAKLRVRSVLIGVALLGATMHAVALDVGFEPRPGAHLPMDAPMFDESDGPATLRAAMAGAPWILTLGYFDCPNLCDTVRADLMGALGGVPRKLAYAVAVVSVDPRERAADASEARIRDAVYRRGSGTWRYLRADAATLAAITQGAGFKDRYDKATGQIAHPAGLVFVTPQGQVSSYLMGVGYSEEHVRQALEDAAAGRIRNAPPAAIALLCFDFDASTGRYSFTIIKLLRAVAILSVLAMAGGLIVLVRTPRAAA